ncbi:hypothetical protein L0F63_007167 [Massospora cicadina]|nr:hypothetical protein L0F63_007167 [Massospora cicadina]
MQPAVLFQEEIDPNQVRRGKLLGRGAFGAVYMVKYKGMTCAMKQLPELQASQSCRMQRIVASLKLEAKALAALGHSPYIVQFVGTCTDGRGRMCMLMEYISGKDLAKLIAEDLGRYRWDARQRLTMELALGVDFIHSKNIIHRDIKSDNVLVEIEGDVLKAKLADFGVCRIEQDLKGLDTGTFLGAGSPLWMAPEIFQRYGVEPTKKTDVYALGVVMWEIAALARPYHGIVDPSCIGQNKLEGIIDDVPPTTPPNYESLMRRCQHPDPQLRPYADEVALLLKRSLGMYETNIHAIDACDMKTLFGTRFYEPTSLNTTTAMLGAIDEEDFVRLLDALETGASEDVKDQLYAIVKLDPDDGLAAFYVGVGSLYFEGARLGRDYRQALNYYEKAAAMGNADGIARLGIMYRFGYGMGEPDYSRALQLFSRAAELGNAAALCSLGECYALGVGTEVDLSRALDHLKLASAKGSPQALYLLGFHYYNGEGFDKDYTKAFELFLQAANSNHADAQFSLGIMYKHGIGVPPDDVAAQSWFRKAAIQGHARAQNNVGSSFYFGLGVPKDCLEAAGWFHKSATQGNAAAQHNLGECYANGRGVGQSYKEAYRWFRRAAEQGHPGAQRSVAIAYFMGHGVDQDQREAVLWFQRSADQGNGRAQCALAQCYLRGQGTEVDPSLGFAWATLAAESGQPEGQYMLASCYLNGSGTSQDYSQAFRWFFLASELGHVQATIALAACFRDGLGTPVSDEECFRCYLKLAERGIPDAMSNVGTCYSSGRGVVQNLEVAFAWFMKAAKADNPSGMTNLAQCYQTGRGVVPSAYEAVQWYTKAAELGSPFAMYNLGACHERGEGVFYKDLQAALRYYTSAADLGFMPARARLEDLQARMVKSQCKQGSPTPATLSADSSPSNTSFGMLIKHSPDSTNPASPYSPFVVPKKRDDRSKREGCATM